MGKKPTSPTQNYYPKLLLELIGSKWTIPVMYSLQTETKRYNEIHKAVPHTTQKVLTGTLKQLERNGIIERTVHPTSPPKVDYRLTELGRELLGVTDTMAVWAGKNHAQILSAQKAYDSRKKTH